VGSGFYEASGLRCHFGSVSVPATFVNSSLITCLTPAQRESGSKSVHLKDADATLDLVAPLPFTCRPAIAVLGLSPSIGPEQGGTVVSVSGKGFADTGKLSCRFVVPATFASATALKCTSPDLTSGASPNEHKIANGRLVSVEVSLDGLQYTSQGVQFTVYAPVTVAKVEPSSGPVSGGSAVLVHGANFLPLDTLVCRFGMGAPAKATWLSSSVVQCASPAWAVKEVVTVEVSNSAADYSASGVSLEYEGVATLTAVQPVFGSCRGGTRVAVMSTSFVNATAAGVLSRRPTPARTS
jgi:hypothetical protein